MNSTLNDIICNLFRARDVAHKLHLKTSSFAAHIALSELYEALVEMADDIAEAYQGKYGKVNIDNCSNPFIFDSSSARNFIQQLVSWAELSKNYFNPQDTYLLSEWDMVISKIYKTKYKLENLT